MNKQISRSELGAEFFGSMILLIAAISPTLMFTLVFEADAGIALLANGIGVAFILCGLIEMFGPVSGAHFNPVVTMVMVFEKKIGVPKALLFVLAQFAGGIGGIVLSHLMFFDKVGDLLSVSDTVRDGYVFFGEILGTFILILTILLLVKTKSKKTSIIIGLVVGGLIFSTSSTMFANPQVTVARMFTGTSAGIRPVDGFIFVAMQLTGALLAYVVYRLVFADIVCGEN